MIRRRSFIGATSALPFTMFTNNAEGKVPALDKEDERQLISAFFVAGNYNNWQFVSDILADGASGRTNHSHWAAWDKARPNDKKKEILEQESHGILSDKDSLFDFYRTRQYQQGWWWRLPNGLESIWSPKIGIYCCYSNWERVDGGSYRKGPVDLSPTFMHVFKINRIENFGALVSNEIIWVQEVDLRNIVYG